MPSNRQPELPAVGRAAPSYNRDADYRVIFDIVSDAILIHDPNDGSIVDANRRACELFGYSREELIGKNAELLTDEGSNPADIPNVDRLRCALSRGANSFTWVGRRGDGARFRAEVTLNPVTLAGCQHVAAIIQDTTERDEIELAARQSEERFRAAAESLSDLMFEYDYAEDTVQWFGDLDACLGFEPGSGPLTLHEWQSLVHPEDLRCEPNRPKRYQQVYRIRGGDGNYRYWEEKAVAVRFDDNDRPVRYVGVCKDLTAKKTAEENLRQSEERHRRLVENATVGIVVVQDGRLTYANPIVERLSGYSFNELTEGSFLRFVHPDDRDRVAGIHRSRFTEGQPPHTYQTRFLTRAGETRCIEVGGVVIEWDGRPATLNFINDITELKAAIDALRSERALVQRLTEMVPVGIAVMDSEGIVTFANPRAEELLGLSIDEISKRSYNAPQWHITDLDGGDFPDDRLPFSIVKRTGRPVYNVQHGIERPSGRRVLLSISAGPLFNESGELEGVVAALEDITERKDAERTLRDSEARFRNIVESSPMGMHLYRLDSKGRLIFEGANPSADKILGVSHDRFVGRAIEEAFPPLAQTEVPLRYAEAAAEGKTWQTEKIMYNDGVISGAFHVVAFQTSPGRMAAMFNDITERKRAEEEVRKFKTIADQAPYGVAISDVDGRLLYVNGSFAAMHGYTPDELIGQRIDVLHTESQRRQVASILESMKETGSFTSREVWHRHRDGQEFPTLMSGVVVLGESGQVQFLAAAATDISELKRLQDFAARAQRLETAGRIAGQVAHDFNNLLGPLVAYPELLKEAIGEHHSAASYISAMENAALQIAEINQQLLTLGRRGHYNLEPVSLNEVVRQVLGQLQNTSKKVNIVTQFGSDLFNVNAGTAQISRLAFNLINNALDAIDGQGTLKIRTENWYADKLNGNFGQVPQGEYVKLTVSDTGCGIDPEHLNHIFEPFFTTKTADRKRGSGLGLSVVHAVVQDHDGHIDIESKPGQGTSVYVYLPVTREAAQVGPEDSLVGGNESILVVDDDPVQREVSTSLLGLLGYHVTAVASGEEALSYLETQPCDLLILDMIMPGEMDGADILERALAIKPAQRAMIVSGFAESERVLKAQELGAGTFLKKPLTRSVLARAVRDELDRTITC